MCTLGGVNYKWLSPEIIGLGVATIVLIGVFLAVEGRAAEPVLPPHLFRNRVFSVTSAIGFVVGFALFGSITYLALFLQVVNGASPTGSGLQILPLMGGLLITSIGSGQAITRTGKYKIFPVIGTFVMIIGLYLLSRMDASTSRLVSSVYMFVLGLGLGLVMQVLVLAVQNAVDYSDLGVATSGATLFRSIGGSVGTAILGSIFSSRLASQLAAGLRTHPSIAPSQVAKLSTAGSNPAALKRLPRPVHDLYVGRVHALARPRVPDRRVRRRGRVPGQLAARAAAAARHRRGEQRHRRVLRGAKAGGLAGRDRAGAERADRTRGPAPARRADRRPRRCRSVGRRGMAAGALLPRARAPRSRRRARPGTCRSSVPAPGWPS